jgi:non-ribosomal peptide synthetase component E (peptide arylation enzyme)
MAFENGHPKIGGRQKGTPNKKTLIKADDLLLELGVNPIQKLVEIAESDLSSLDQKINCYKEIAKYTYPKFKSQDIRIEHQQEYPDVIKVIFVDPDGSETSVPN